MSIVQGLFAWFAFFVVSALALPGFFIARALFFPPSAEDVRANVVRMIERADAEGSMGKCPLAWSESSDVLGAKTCVLKVVE